MGKKLPKNWVNSTLYSCLLPVKTGVLKYAATKKYYSTGSIKDDTIEAEGEYYYEKKPSRANREVELYDILQARMAETDKAFLVTEKYKDSIFSTGFIQLRVYAKTINPKLVYYFLKSNQFNQQKNILSTGATQVSINDRNAKEIVFPLPPLPEQTRIVAKLDHLFGQLGQINQSLDKIPQLLKDFRQQVLTQALSGELSEVFRIKNNLPIWKKTLLESISSLITSGSRGWAKYYSDEGAIFVRAQNINKDYLDLNDIAFVNLGENSEGIRTRIFENDILITITGANVTKTAIVNFPIKEAYVSQHVSLVRLNYPEMARYIYIFLISKSDGRKQLLDFAYGQGKPQLNLSNVRNVEINLPSLSEQNEIVTRVETLFAKADIIEQQYQILKQKIDSLPQAILHKAFKGELVEQLASDGDARALLAEIQAMKKQHLKPNAKQNVRLSPSAGSGQAKVEALATTKTKTKQKNYKVEDEELGRVAEEGEKYE